MRSQWLDAVTAYDGSQLRAHWILRNTGVAGDAVVAFRGPCAVTTEEMADLEDLLSGPGIRAADMVHFLVEVFDDGDLLRAIYLQRLFAAAALDTLRALAPDAAPRLRRAGDDLYLDGGKLSISVASRSLVSTLIHFALNVTNAGTPVETASLGDLGLAPEPFAAALMQRLVEEHDSAVRARVKVRARGEA